MVIRVYIARLILKFFSVNGIRCRNIVFVTRLVQGREANRYASLFYYMYPVLFYLCCFPRTSPNTNAFYSYMFACRMCALLRLYRQVYVRHTALIKTMLLFLLRRPLQVSDNRFCCIRISTEYSSLFPVNPTTVLSPALFYFLARVYLSRSDRRASCNYGNTAHKNHGVIFSRFSRSCCFYIFSFLYEYAEWAG